MCIDVSETAAAFNTIQQNLSPTFFEQNRIYLACVEIFTVASTPVLTKVLPYENFWKRDIVTILKV